MEWEGIEKMLHLSNNRTGDQDNPEQTGLLEKLAITRTHKLF